VQSVSGSIELRLPVGLGADFEAESFSGSIRNELGPEASTAREHGHGHTLRFQTGNASARVSLESFSGDIRILKK
jgi:predicted membrane protein